MEKQLVINIGPSSSKGRKKVNQDFHGAFIPKQPLLGLKGVAVAVADGISSSQVNQVASETAVSGFLSRPAILPVLWAFTLTWKWITAARYCKLETCLF